MRLMSPRSTAPYHTLECAPRRHVAEHDRGFGDVNAFAELRPFAQERVELLYRFLHAGNLTADGAGVADFSIASQIQNLVGRAVLCPPQMQKTARTE